MSETLLWSDDFAYGSQAAYEAAYPYQYDNSITSVFSTIVSPGPSGYATGVTTKRLANDDYAGGLDVTHWLINPTTRCFHYRAVYKIDTVDVINPSGALVSMGWGTATDFFGDYWQLSVRQSDLTELALTVNGGTYPAPAYFSGYVPSILTPGAANEVDVSGEISSLAETSPGSGVYAPNADGSVTVKVNGATVLSWSGIVWDWENTHATPVWNMFQIMPSGTMSGLRIWQCGSAAVVDDSDICSCTSLNPDTAAAGGGTGAGASPVQYPSIGAQLMCAGGGLVPTQADLTFSEVWWGN